MIITVPGELLKLVPKSFWPSAFYINGTLIEPLHARCYQGSGGSELCGFLSCTLSSSLRDAKGNTTKWKSIFQEHAREIMEKYSDEIKQIESTYVVFDKELQPGIIPRKRKLNFPSLKKNVYERYYQDLERKLDQPVTKQEFYKVLDNIFIREL